MPLVSSKPNSLTHIYLPHLSVGFLPHSGCPPLKMQPCRDGILHFFGGVLSHLAHVCQRHLRELRQHLKRSLWPLWEAWRLTTSTSGPKSPATPFWIMAAVGRIKPWTNRPQVFWLYRTKIHFLLSLIPGVTKFFDPCTMWQVRWTRKNKMCKIIPLLWIMYFCKKSLHLAFAQKGCIDLNA